MDVVNAPNVLTPVIAIDGPSASGKGTVAVAVAERLGFHYLDSGALYRLVALAALKRGVSWDDEHALGAIVVELDACFERTRVVLDGIDVSADIRSERCSEGASKVARWLAVRAGLLDRQRAFRQPPGLVADGRDMGSVVFPHAELKIFLTAGLEARAERRTKQLNQKGIAANLRALLQDLRERDLRDSTRSIAPLVPADGSLVLDTTELAVSEVVDTVLDWFHKARRSGVQAIE